MPRVPRLARGLVLLGPRDTQDGVRGVVRGSGTKQRPGLVCVRSLEGQVTGAGGARRLVCQPWREALLEGSPQPCPLGRRALSSVFVRKDLAVSPPRARGPGPELPRVVGASRHYEKSGRPQPFIFPDPPTGWAPSSLNQPLLSCRAPTEDTPLPVPEPVLLLFHFCKVSRSLGTNTHCAPWILYSPPNCRDTALHTPLRAAWGPEMLSGCP